MRIRLRRLRRRAVRLWNAHFRQAPTAPEPAAVPWPVAVPGVRVVDATGYPGLADLASLTLTSAGHAVVPVDELQLEGAEDGAVLLMPAQPETPVAAAEGLAFVLDRIARDPALGARMRARLVVVWCVPHADRQVLAAPAELEADGPAGWNAAGLLFGTGWRRAVGASGGDPSAAILSRHREVLRLLCTTRAAHLGGQDTAEQLARLRNLDPHVLHMIWVEVPDDPEPGSTLTRWRDPDELVAAIALRLGSL